MTDPETQEDARRKRIRIVDLTAVGLAFPIAIVLGGLAGRWLGGLVGARDPGTLIGVLFGVAGGFYNLLKLVRRLAPHTGEEGSDDRGGD